MFFVTALSMAVIGIFSRRNKASEEHPAPRAMEALAERRRPLSSPKTELPGIDESAYPDHKAIEKAFKASEGTVSVDSLSVPKKKVLSNIEKEKIAAEREAYAAHQKRETGGASFTPPKNLPPGMTPEAWAFNAELEARRPEFAASRRALAERVKIDRAKYVRPAPQGFEPETVGRKIKIRLILKKKTLKLGELYASREPLTYRVEIQNVGSKDVTWNENSSFIKTGDLEGSELSFFSVSPDGKETELQVAYSRGIDIGSAPIGIPGFEAMSEEEKDAAIKREIEQDKHSREMFLHLRPGEILFSRADQEPELFRDFTTDHDFKPFRTYGIKLVLNDPPPDPPDEEYIQKYIKRGFSRAETMKRYRREVDDHFGVVESNTVMIRTLP